MPKHSDYTTKEEASQENRKQDDWEKEVVPRLPKDLEEQAMKLKAFERCREIGSAIDLLRGLLAYVYTQQSFQHLGMWSILIGLANISANAWRKRLRKASPWLDWLLQEELAMADPISPWLARAGLGRILLVDGTHWKCLGPKGIVMRVHTAFDLLAGRLTQVKVTDSHEGEHLEVFELKSGDLVVTDRANGLRKRIAFVLSKLADIIVRISPSKFPMENEQGEEIVLIDWLKGLQASAGAIRSRSVWITYVQKRIKLRLVAFRLSEEQQVKAERRTKRKASKNQNKVQPTTLYFSGWVLLVTTLPKEHWSDQQILQLYQARWHIELLFKRIKQFLKLQTLRCKTVATAKPAITALLLGWTLLEQESAAVRLAMRNAVHCTHETQNGKPKADLITSASWWQDDQDDQDGVSVLPAENDEEAARPSPEMGSGTSGDLLTFPPKDGDPQDGPLSEWMLAHASFDLLCQQIRGTYTAERFRACLPRLQRFLCCGHRKRPHLYSQVCRWLGTPATEPPSEVMAA